MMRPDCYTGEGPDGTVALARAIALAAEDGCRAFLVLSRSTYTHPELGDGMTVTVLGNQTLDGLRGAESATAPHTPLTKALGVSDPEKFYQDFEVTRSSFAAPETVRRAVILRARGHAIPVKWDTEWGIPTDPLDEFVHELHRTMGDAIKASQDPEIHAAGDLITDQVRAMGEKLKAYREQADPAPRELMLALACGIHAVVHALLAKTPGDPDLTEALGQLERTIKESKQ